MVSVTVALRSSWWEWILLLRDPVRLFSTEANAVKARDEDDRNSINKFIASKGNALTGTELQKNSIMCLRWSLMGSSEGLERCVVPMLGTRNQSLNGSCESAREGSVGTSNAGAGRSRAEQQFFLFKIYEFLLLFPPPMLPHIYISLRSLVWPPFKKETLRKHLLRS